jgi:hypothetical protein
MYCEQCLASQVSSTMPPAQGASTVVPGAPPPVSHGSPGLAALLGFIPGVGAFYNGEYAKGFIHVVIFGTLIWASDHVSGLFGIGIAAFYLYMPFEAYQTAKAKLMGVPAPDPFGLNNLSFGGGSQVTQPAAPPAAPPAPGFTPDIPPPGQPVQPAQPLQPDPYQQAEPQRVPPGALILIALGVIFLFSQFGWFHFDWFGRFWPLILIAIGISVLMKRTGRGW